jgi:hypothetical protein
VDLGELESILLRNVPPTPANYAQRAGRAGRRLGAAAFVVTYAQRRSHDLTYYNTPLRMIAGRVRPPAFRLDNERIVRRHLYATVFSSYFRTRPDAFGRGQAEDLFGTTEAPRNAVSDMEQFLDAKPAHLQQALEQVAPASLHASLGLPWDWTPGFLREATASLERVQVEYHDECAHYLRVEHEASAAGQHSRANFIQRVRRTVELRYLLGVLANRGLFPKYGFPVDVVPLEIAREAMAQVERPGFGAQLDDLGLDLQRRSSLAISEYAPGSEVVAGGYVWKSYGLKVLPNRALPEVNYTVCSCGAFQLVPPGSEPTDCGYCGQSSSQVSTGRYVSPEFGFVTDAQRPKRASTRRPERHYASRLAFAGYLTQEPVEYLSRWPNLAVGRPLQARLVTINSGRGGGGFSFCQSCGFAQERKSAIPREHKTPRGRTCHGRLSVGVHLGHEFITDVLELRGAAVEAMKQSDWWSVGYAVTEGAASALGIRRDDLDVTIRVAPGGGYSIFMLDSVPGGAGHVVRIHEHLPLVLRQAWERVASCSCEDTTSCYECLRTFGNQRLHSSLSRGVAQRFLGAALGIGEPAAASQNGQAGDTAGVLGLVVDPVLRSMLVRLTSEGLPMPEVGYEVINEQGAIVGEFEAAWPEQRVGIPTTAEFGPPNWHVIAAADAIAAPGRLRVALGLAAD